MISKMTRFRICVLLGKKRECIPIGPAGLNEGIDARHEYAGQDQRIEEEKHVRLHHEGLVCS